MESCTSRRTFVQLLSTSVQELVFKWAPLSARDSNTLGPPIFINIFFMFKNVCSLYIWIRIFTTIIIVSIVICVRNLISNIKEILQNGSVSEGNIWIQDDKEQQELELEKEDQEYDDEEE